MADSKNFAEGNMVAESNKNLTRTGIMNVLKVAIVGTLAQIEGLSLSNVAHLRRTVRALATLAVRMMLDAGAPPEVVAQQLLEALGHELQEREAKNEAEGTAQAAEAKEAGGSPIFAVVKGDGSLKN